MSDFCNFIKYYLLFFFWIPLMVYFDISDNLHYLTTNWKVEAGWAQIHGKAILYFFLLNTFLREKIWLNTFLIPFILMGKFVFLTGTLMETVYNLWVSHRPCILALFLIEQMPGFDELWKKSKFCELCMLLCICRCT